LIEDTFNKINNIDPDAIVKLKLTLAIQELEFADTHYVIFVKNRIERDEYLNMCVKIGEEMGYDISSFNDNRIKITTSQYSLIFDIIAEKYCNSSEKFNFISMI